MNQIPGIDITAVGRVEPGRATDSLAGPTLQRTNTTNNTSNGGAVTININGGDVARVKQAVLGVLNEQYSGAETNLKSQTDY